MAAGLGWTLMAVNASGLEWTGMHVGGRWAMRACCVVTARAFPFQKRWAVGVGGALRETKGVHVCVRVHVREGRGHSASQPTSKKSSRAYEHTPQVG